MSLSSLCPIPNLEDQALILERASLRTPLYSLFDSSTETCPAWGHPTSSYATVGIVPSFVGARRPLPPV